MNVGARFVSAAEVQMELIKPATKPHHLYVKIAPCRCVYQLSGSGCGAGVGVLERQELVVP